MPRLRGSKQERIPTDSRRAKLRYDALKRAHGACECCGTGGTPENPLEVDHIKPMLKYPELQFDPDNLQILCKMCNLGKGATDETDWRNPFG